MLPKDIQEDNSKSIYILYNSNDLIVEKWTRKPHMDDTKVKTNKDGVVTLPTFYGEWVQTPQEEVDNLNEAILAKKPAAIRKALQNPDKTNNPQSSRPAKRLTQRELSEQHNRSELEKMLEILNKRYEELNNQGGKTNE